MHHQLFWDGEKPDGEYTMDRQSLWPGPRLLHHLCVRSVDQALFRQCISLVGFTSQGAIRLTCVHVFLVFVWLGRYLCARMPADPRAVYNAARGAKSGAASRVLHQRLAWDPLIALLYGLCAFAVHATQLFKAGGDILRLIVGLTIFVVGVALHYIWPELRNPRPWRILKRPIVNERRRPSKPDGLSTMDRLHSVLAFFEAHIAFPVAIACALDTDAPHLVQRFGLDFGSFLVTLCTFKLLRQAYCDRSTLWVSFSLAMLFSEFDKVDVSEGLLVDWLVATILVAKTGELMLKLGFSYTYRAPWNHKDVLGSGLHAFLMPLQWPHTAVCVFQSVVSTLVSAPLYPVMGSPVFLVSYFRPIKFFERRFTTKRIEADDDATTKSYTVGSTSNNLNSVFYIQLQRELEKRLAKDIDRGVLGTISAGDIMLLTNTDNNMSAFLHIIDVGHGFVSFQLRGLEFAGTFCQVSEHYSNNCQFTDDGEHGRNP